jgi:hypothetical protein
MRPGQRDCSSARGTTPWRYRGSGRETASRSQHADLTGNSIASTIASCGRNRTTPDTNSRCAAPAKSTLRNPSSRHTRIAGRSCIRWDHRAKRAGQRHARSWDALGLRLRPHQAISGFLARLMQFPRVGVAAAAVPADHLDAGMGTQPGGERVSGPLVEHVDDLVREHVDQHGAIPVATPQGEIVDLPRLRGKSTYLDVGIIPTGVWVALRNGVVGQFRDAEGHDGRDNYRLSRKVSRASVGRYLPVRMDGGVVRARARSLMVMSAWR